MTEIEFESSAHATYVQDCWCVNLICACLLVSAHFGSFCNDRKLGQLLVTYLFSIRTEDWAPSDPYIQRVRFGTQFTVQEKLGQQARG